MMKPSITALPVRGRWTFDQSTKQLYVKAEGHSETNRISKDFFNTRPSGYHGACDVIGLDSGTTIRAQLAGYIRRVGWESGGWGKFSIFKGGDGHEYVSAHLKSSKAKGTKVSAGSSIAVSDNTGNSSGAHYHCEKWWVPGERDSRVDLFWEWAWLTEKAMGKSYHVNPYRTPSEPGRAIQKGDRSYAVMWVQWSLGDSRIDGRFDESLRLKVIAFQKSKGWSPTGKVGPLTWAELKKIRRAV